MNIFDSLEASMFATTCAVMGYDATWNPSDGGVSQEARVLLNNPTKDKELQGITYDPRKWSIEFHKSTLTGLFESVRSGGEETIVVNGQPYVIYEVKSKYDGDTYHTQMQPTE